MNDEIPRIRATFEAGQVQEAELGLALWLRANPPSAEAFELAGDLRLSQHDISGALKEYGKSARITRPTLGLTLKIGSTLVEAGDPSRGAAIYKQAIRDFPNSALPIIELADLIASFGNWTGALAELKAARRIDPRNPRAILMTAQCLTELGRAEEAELLLAETVAQDPSAESYSRLGFLQQSQGRFEAAWGNFLSAVEHDTGHGPAYFGLGQGRRLGSDEEPVIQKALEALEAGKVTPDAEMVIRFFLGKAMEDQERFPESAEQYERANNVAFRVQLGGVPFRKESHAQAMSQTVQRFPSLTSSQTGDRPKVAPIFVVGMMRSGTTLVEQILSSHPAVTGGGERDFWPDHRPESFNPANLPKLRSAYLRDIAEVREERGWVVDKMPSNYQNLGAIHLAFPSSPIVHVRRSPADTCLSIYTTAYSLSPEFAHQRDAIVFVYREYVKLMEHWRAILPPSVFIEIDYEDLVRDREATVRSLVTRIGISWEDQLLSHEKNARTVTTPSVWQVRQPIYNSSIGRYERFAPFFPEFGEI